MAVKLPKSIIKKFGISKRAWAEYRKQTGKKPGAKTRGAAPKSEGEKMATKKKTRKRGRVRARARAVTRRASKALATRPGQVVVAAGTAAAGGVASSLIVNYTPVLKDQGKLTKALLQGGLGMLGIFFLKNRFAKALGAGAVIASGFTLTKELLKVNPLAGPGDKATLTPDQMRSLVNGQARLNSPVSDMRLGAPVRDVRMNVPADVRMGYNPMTSSIDGGWGKSGW